MMKKKVLRNSFMEAQNIFYLNIFYLNVALQQLEQILLLLQPSLDYASPH